MFMQQHCINMQIYDCLFRILYKYTGGQKEEKKKREEEEKEREKEEGKKREERKEERRREEETVFSFSYLACRGTLIPFKSLHFPC